MHLTNTQTRKQIWFLLCMMPALAVGTLTMIGHGVPLGIWIQNLLVWILLLPLSVLLGGRAGACGRQKACRNTPLVVGGVVVLLLMATFLFGGLDGVHRWIPLGPVRVQVASVLLPVLIVALWRLFVQGRQVLALGMACSAGIVLLLQPDAGQLTAFVVAALVVVIRKDHAPWRNVVCCACGLGAILLSWLHLDGLPPVAHVEGILWLAAERGAVWLTAGILSLLLLLLPFLAARKTTVGLALGAYVAATLLVPCFGNFPVPVMGYGISPIIGYGLAVFALGVPRGGDRE